MRSGSAAPVTDYGMIVSKPIIRRALLDWIVDTRCDYAVTLTFNRETPLYVARGRLKEWLYRFEHHIRGCRPHRLPPEKRLMAFIVPEHIETNIHFHLAIRLIDRVDVTPLNVHRILEQGERIWRCLQPSGSFLAKRVDDRRGWGRYITKDCYRVGSEVILAHDFHSMDKR